MQVLQAGKALPIPREEATPVKKSSRMHSQMVKAMKLLIVLLTATCLTASAGLVAQRITLNESNAPAKKVFAEIEKQSGFFFMYNYESLQKARPISVKVTDATLEEVLDKCFKDQPLAYNIIDRLIVVKEKIILTDAAKLTEKPASLLPIDVTGKVLNEQGKPVEGVAVTIKGTDKFTFTNANGEFSLNSVAQDAVLIFTGVNIEPFELKVSGKTELIVNLKSHIQALENVEIVHTGYQQLPKERATGSFTFITRERLEQRIAPDIISKIEGIGNSIVFNKSTVGENIIKIRGESTIYGNASPLIVVNNFPYDGDINNLNPNDVESITILKDAAAASIWGVQAGNGVIVITTKNGKFNQPLRVSLNSNVTIVEKPDLFYKPQINPSDYIDVEKFLFDQGHYDGLGIFFDPGMPVISPVVEILDLQRNGLITPEEATRQIDALRKYDLRNDLNKYVYRNAVHQQHSLNFSGGSPKTSYYFSVGYDRDLPEVKGNSSDRITLNLQNRFTPLKNLELNLSMFYTEGITRSNGPGTPNAFPYTRLKDDNGNELAIPQHRSGFEDTIEQHGFYNWKYYPLQEPNNADNRRRNTDIRAALGVKYTLIKGLALEGNYQYTRSLSRSRDVTKKNNYQIRDLLNNYAIVSDGNYIGTNYPDGGKLFLASSDLVGHYGRLALTYEKSWPKHAINAIAGMNVQEISSESSSQSFLGYNDDNGSFATPLDFITYYQLFPSGNFAPIGIPTNTYSGGTLNRFRSYFGNAAYTYNDRYIFSASARLDGSNYFGVKTKQKAVPLWSAGFRWDINKESFYHSAAIPRLSLRLSYGYNGNLDFNTTAVTTIIYGGGIANFTGLPYAVLNNIPNPELRWERTSHFNAGIDFGILKNRLTGSIEYYRKSGTDLIGDAPIDPTTGVSQIRGNFSAMKSNGIDFLLTSKNINRALQWQTTFIFNYSAEKITRYDLDIPAGIYLGAFAQVAPRVGKPLYSLYSYRFGGLDGSTGDPQGYVGGSTSTDYSAILTSTGFNDLVYSGRYNPPVFGSVFNQFTWKGLTLSFNITYKLNYYFRRSTINYSQLFGDWRFGHSDVALRWQKPGDENTTTVPSMIYPGDQSRDAFYINSTALVEKGDHVRLQYANLTYALDQRALGKLPIKNLQFYVYANNLNLMLWKSNNRGIDPDYPFAQRPSRSWALGLQAGF